MPDVEKAIDAEARIHQQMNKEWEVDAAERKLWEDSALHHPLKDTWVATMDLKPETPDVNLVCWKDCYERNRIRRLECDEVRRRVERKLKDLGCPTTLIANEEPSPCGDPTAAVASAAPPVVPQQQPGYYYYPPGYAGGY